MTNIEESGFMRSAKRAIWLRGHDVSAASLENEDHAYAYSVKSRPGTFGHPELEVHIDKRTGDIQIS